MDLSNKIIELVRKNIEFQDLKITENSNLIDDLYIDSFGKVMLVNAIEDEFKVTLSDGELAQIKTVKDIINGLEKKLNQVVV